MQVSTWRAWINKYRGAVMSARKNSDSKFPQLFLQRSVWGFRSTYICRYRVAWSFHAVGSFCPAIWGFDSFISASSSWLVNTPGSSANNRAATFRWRLIPRARRFFHFLAIRSRFRGASIADTARNCYCDCLRSWCCCEIAFGNDLFIWMALSEELPAIRDRRVDKIDPRLSAICT